MKRLVVLTAAVLAVLVSSAGSGSARTNRAAVAVYPSGTSFTATGAAPSGSTSSVSLSMPIGGVDDATILVRGASKVSIQAPTIASPLQLKLLFAHYVSMGGQAVPDALEPWDGSQRASEKPNQPLWLQATVPYGTQPGRYAGSVQVVADGSTTTVPITVTVFDVTLPQPNQVSGSLLTAFNFSPQSYGDAVERLYGISARDSVQTVLPQLFSFFASYRLSPNNWGYGNPNAKSGYTSSNKYWLDKKTNMVNAVGNPRQFGTMWIPISNNRWPKHGYVGGLSPFAPQTWCSYLRSVRSFWQEHGWLTGTYPYLYGLDEPGGAVFKVVQQQAQVAHACFAGSHVIVTGKPSKQNKYLWNGGKDDVDAWVVLPSRYYGKFTVPAQSRKHKSHATDWLKQINKARKHGAEIWTYVYRGIHTPTFNASEPLTDARLVPEWAALEGLSGLLYGEGTTTYPASGNPLSSIDKAGEFALIYPGRDAPIPSARLEVLREGIEDWEILNVVRKRNGTAGVARLLSKIFSTTPKGAKLACTIGCPLRSKTPFAWPLYSHDATTPGKLAAMRLAALNAAS